MIHHADLESGFLITEDFGSASFVEGKPPTPIVERYQAATDCWPRCIVRHCPTPCRWRRSAYTIPVFDTEAMLVEVGLMLDWYLPDRGIEPSEACAREFMTIWRALLAKPRLRPEPGCCVISTRPI